MVPPGHTILLEKRHFVLDLRVIPKKEAKLPVNPVNSYFISVLQIIVRPSNVSLMNERPIGRHVPDCNSPLKFPGVFKEETMSI